MANDPQLDSDLTTTAQPVRVNLVAMGLACICMMVWLLSLSRHIVAPLGWDQSLYQFCIDRVVDGQRMYADLLDHNGPGILGIHYLSTMLLGREQIDIRLFDAGWQLLTIIAMVTLAGRDSGRWHVGWIAATLYVLAIYGYPPSHTAEREGFAVLPLLLAIHAVTGYHNARINAILRFSAHAFAGFCCLLVMSLKPPLGACYGVLWIFTLIEAWQHRRDGSSAWVNIVGLTFGFIATAAAAVLILMRLDWWNAYWPILTTSGPTFPKGYVRGPSMMLTLLPYVAVTASVLALWTIGSAINARHNRHVSFKAIVAETSRNIVAGLVIFGLLLTLIKWQEWRETIISVIGLLIPVCGAIALSPWQSRSRTWRLCLLMCGAGLFVVFLQGRFMPYRYAIVLAMAAYPAAYEIATVFAQRDHAKGSSKPWAMICMVCLLHLGMTHWWPQMTRPSTQLSPLAGMTLEQHYARIINASATQVNYDTAKLTAARVQQLTAPTEPIMMLFYEPRLSYLIDRPAAHRLFIPRPSYKTLFSEFIESLRQNKPAIMLARIPKSHRDSLDPEAIREATFAQLEEHFGPEAVMFRTHFAITETIGEIALLQPTMPAENQTVQLQYPSIKCVQ